MRMILFPFSALLLAIWIAPARAEVDCEAIPCPVQAVIDQQCPCEGAVGHGAHVRCVAQEVKRLVADGTIPQTCKGKVIRCAARSTCGRKRGVVTCEIPEVQGTCAIGLGFCVHEGSILYSMPCSADTDCVIESRCKISASAERCVARGGRVAARATCCPPCAPQTACGPDLTCDGRSEMCVLFGPVGPGGVIHTCAPVPAGCELNRTCGCVAATLCPPPDICSDLDVPGDVIFCECTRCV